jgi:hypothetical protein
MGGMNVSESLAKLIIEKAPEVTEEVNTVLLPKWLKQRGMSMSFLENLRK